MIPLKTQTNLEKVQHLTVGLLLRNGFGILKLVLSEGDEDLLLLSSGPVFTLSLIFALIPWINYSLLESSDGHLWSSFKSDSECPKG